MRKTLVALGLVVSALGLSACGGGGDESPSVNVPLYGYYGNHGNQVEETRDHTNLFWEAFWHKDDALAFANIRAANKFTVVDVQRMFEYRADGLRLRADGADKLRRLFSSMRYAGLLHLVGMIVPLDEPNLPENIPVCLDIVEAIATIRTVASEYAELQGVLVGAIYYNRSEKCGMGLLDVVGFDDYQRGANILAPGGDYVKMREQLAPHQRTMLVPGGSYGQDPRPFVEFAKRNHEVLAIVPFIWRYPSHKNEEPSIATVPGMRELYEAAGRGLTRGTL